MILRNINDMESFIRVNTLNELQVKDYHFKEGDTILVLENLTFYRITTNNSDLSISIKNGFYINLISKLTSEALFRNSEERLQNLIDNLENNKENNINKRTGFNLNKSDEDNLDDTNSLATSKAINKVKVFANELKERLDNLKLTWVKITGKPEPKNFNEIRQEDNFNYFTSSGAFELQNLIRNNSSLINNVIEQNRVKFLEIQSSLDGKEPVFNKNTAFNLNKSDSISNDNSNELATSKAVKLVNDNTETRIIDSKISDIEENTLNENHKTGIYKETNTNGINKLTFNINSKENFGNIRLAQIRFGNNNGLEVRTDNNGTINPYSLVWTNKNFDPDTKLTKYTPQGGTGFTNGRVGIIAHDDDKINFQSPTGTINFNHRNISSVITRFRFLNGTGGFANVEVGNLTLTNKTSSVTDSSETTLATAKAVKTVQDNLNSVNSALNNKFNSYEPKITKNNGFNLNKSDDNTTNNSNILATTKCVYNGVNWCYNNTVKKTGDTISGNLTIGGTAQVKGILYANNWVYSSGSYGMYFSSYGGGWHMTDGTWIRAYNSKALLVNATIRGTRVENAVWNDYAELFPKRNNVITEAGDIIALSLEGDEEYYEKATLEHNLIVGVHSDEYGHLIGGNKPDEDSELTLEEFNKDTHIPVGLVGRVSVKFKGIAKKGMKVIPSDIAGVGKEYDGINKDKIIGYVVENNSEEGIRRVRIKLI